MNDMQALEKRLAELLGWTDLYEYHGYVGRFRGFAPEGNIKDLPSWTADDAAAFQLAVHYELPTHFWHGSAWVGSGDDYFFQNEYPEDHDGSDMTAMRVAIVKGVIAKLEAGAAQ